MLGFHIGTEPVDPTGLIDRYYRCPGGAVLNYCETTSGPFMADRIDEAYRQHGAAVHPRHSKLPSEYLYEQVYASFQHNRSAVLACQAMGW